MSFATMLEHFFLPSHAYPLIAYKSKKQQEDNYMPPLLISHSHSFITFFSFSLSLFSFNFLSLTTDQVTYSYILHHHLHKINPENMELVDNKMLQQQQQQQEQHFHVLAVDDSVIDRKVLERLLRGSSCKVTCVDSGDKALKYLGLNDDDLDDNNTKSLTSIESSSSPPPSQPLQHEGIKVNLIMTDYCMPGMSGYDLLKRVKGSSWKDIPVVVMSSENVPSRISMCLEEGAEEFLLKPLQLSDLKKLQPYFLKSLENSSEQEFANNSIASDNDHLIINNNNSNMMSNNNINNSISKRKAVSPEPPERARPKMKGLLEVA